MENPETLEALDTRHGMKVRKTKTLHRKLKDEQQGPQQIESRMWTYVYEQYQWQWKNIALISYCIIQHKENVNWDVIKFTLCIPGVCQSESYNVCLHYTFQASANLRATTFVLLFALFCFCFLLFYYFCLSLLFHWV